MYAYLLVPCDKSERLSQLFLTRMNIYGHSMIWHFYFRQYIKNKKESKQANANANDEHNN